MQPFPDPHDWTPTDLHLWLDEVIQNKHNMSVVDYARWEMTGAQLCALSREQFTELSAEIGDFVYTCLQAWLEGVVWFGSLSSGGGRSRTEMGGGTWREGGPGRRWQVSGGGGVKDGDGIWVGEGSRTEMEEGGNRGRRLDVGRGLGGGVRYGHAGGRESRTEIGGQRG